MKQYKYSFTLVFGILLIMSFLTCGCTESVEYEENYNSLSQEVENISVEGNIVWECYSLDVDGNEINDYAFIEIIYENNEYWNILKIQLDSGKTCELKFIGKTKIKADIITAQVGKIFYSDRDSIVIEITDSMSNYGSTDIHLLNLYENANEFEIVEELTVLDGMKSSELYDTYKDTAFIIEDVAVSITSQDELVKFYRWLNASAIQITEYNTGNIIYLFRKDNEWNLIREFPHEANANDKETEEYIREYWFNDRKLYCVSGRTDCIVYANIKVLDLEGNLLQELSYDYDLGQIPFFDYQKKYLISVEDVNADGYEDILINAGLTGNASSTYGCFVFDREEESYFRVENFEDINYVTVMNNTLRGFCQNDMQGYNMYMYIINGYKVETIGVLEQKRFLTEDGQQLILYTEIHYESGEVVYQKENIDISEIDLDFWSNELGWLEIRG